MTKNSEVEEQRPSSPRLGHFIAVTLELSMLGVFIYERSYVGLALAASYAWFSATWASFIGFRKDA